MYSSIYVKYESLKDISNGKETKLPQAPLTLSYSYHLNGILSHRFRCHAQRYLNYNRYPFPAIERENT